MSALTPQDRKLAELCQSMTRGPAGPRSRVLPSWQTVVEGLRDLHKQAEGERIGLWLQDPSFEDMAASLEKAMWLADVPSDDTPDDSWIRRQDVAAERMGV